jgi:hypothetical protein
LAICIALALAGAARGHILVPAAERASATPTHPGSGWVGEAYLDIPDAWAASLLAAETFVAGQPPDFTFRTTHIDFPSGPADSLLDTEAATIGDWLDAYLSDVSDPAKLDAPLGNVLVRFRGLIDVRAEYNTFPAFGLPVLFDLGATGYGGYRTQIGSSSILRVQNHVFNDNNPFSTENAIIYVLGLFPVEVAYFNRYDPTNAHGQERVGIEFYTFHPDGLPWPGGTLFSDPLLGNLKVTPPAAVYPWDARAQLPRGDFDADGNVTLADFAILQACFDQPVAGRATCAAMDFDGDGLVGTFDWKRLGLLLTGPGVYPVTPGDFDANSRIDLGDYRWFQWCLDSGGGEDEFRAALPEGCDTFDFNASGRVEAGDYPTFQKLLNGSGPRPHP